MNGESHIKKVALYEIVGVILSIIIGTLLHFVFEWSGNSTIVAPIAAVNESTWEHLKLGFWPLLMWSVIEYFVFGKQYPNFFIAKAVGILAYLLTIPALFYAYTATGLESLAVDILIFIIAIIVGQGMGFRIIKLQKKLRFSLFLIICIVVLCLLFIFFTFNPPKFYIFQDPITGGYGIVK